jgi:hypothetical protein
MLRMTLVPVELQLDRDPLPQRVRALLDDAAALAEDFIEQHRDDPAVGFIPSDYEMAYRALRALSKDGSRSLLTGRLFCEWGSGLGVIAGLASLCGFDSVGIEIEDRLVRASRELMEKLKLGVTIVQGSYMPEIMEIDPDDDVPEQGSITLHEHGRPAYEDLGLEIDDFDCIFAYPWPGEDHIVTTIFDRHAARGAALLTYHGQDGLLLRRKK